MTELIRLVKHNYENNYGHILTGVLLVATFLLMSPLLGTVWGTPLPIIFPAAVLLYSKVFDVYARARILSMNSRNWKVDPDSGL